MVFTRSASKRRLDDNSDESFEDSDTSVIKRMSTNSPSSQPPSVHLVPGVHASSPSSTTIIPPHHHNHHILQHHSNILPPPKPSLLGSNISFAPPLTPLARPQREDSPLTTSAPPHRLPHPISHHPQQHQNSSHGLLNPSVYLDDMSLARVVNETPSARPTSIADLVSPTNYSVAQVNVVNPTPLPSSAKNISSHSQFSIRHRLPRTAAGNSDGGATLDTEDPEGDADEEGDNGGDEAEVDGDDDDDEEDEVETEREQSPMLAAKALTHIIKPKKRKYATNKNEIKINKRVMASDTPEVIKMFKKFDNEVLSNEEARNKLLVLGFETRKRYITTIKHYIRFCVSKGLQDFLVTGELMKEFYEQQFSISGSDNPIIRLRKMDPAFSKLQEINNIAYKLNSKHIPNRYIALEFLISKENASGVDSTSLSDDSAIKRRPVLEHSVSNIEIMRASSTPPITANTRLTRSAFDVRATQIPPVTPLKRESSKLQVQVPTMMMTSSAPVTPASPAPSTSPVSTKESIRSKQSRKTGTLNGSPNSSGLIQKKKKKEKLRKLDKNFMTTVNKAITEINLAISNKHKFINQEIDSLFMNKRLRASDRLDFKLNVNNKLLAMKFEIEDYISGLKNNLRMRQEKSGVDNAEVKVENYGGMATDSDTDEDNIKTNQMDDEMDGLNEDDEDYDIGDDEEEARKNTAKIAMNNEIFTIYEILEEWYVVEPTIESRLISDKLNWVKDEIDLHVFNERKLIIDFIERLSVEFDEDRFLSANHCDRFIREKLILDEFISEIELDSGDLFKRIVRYRQGN